MGLSRPVAHKINLTTTATGPSTGIALFGTGMSAASYTHWQNGSTKDVTFALQGSLGDSGVWAALTGTVAASTVGAAGNSTATLTFDKARINLVANASTGNLDLAFWILAR